MKNSLNKFVAIAAAVAMAVGSLTAAAQARRDGASEISALSALPIASVLVAGSVAATGSNASANAASSAMVIPAALSVSGASLVVSAVEVTARGTVCVLERASDGARVSVQIAKRGAERAALSVGTTVAVTVIGAGTVLSVLGEAVAFIPNELGNALLHNERVTH